MFRVLFERHFTRMISTLKYKWPPGGEGQGLRKDSERIRVRIKGSRMGHSVKVSLWCVTLLINTRFRFFILE